MTLFLPRCRTETANLCRAFVGIRETAFGPQALRCREAVQSRQERAT